MNKFDLEEDFYFTYNNMNSFGYDSYVAHLNSYLYCRMEYKYIVTCFCTPFRDIFNTINGRIASCPISLMKGWNDHVIFSIRIPKNHIEFNLFIYLLEQIEEDKYIWITHEYRNRKTIEEYDYNVRYKLK